MADPIFPQENIAVFAVRTTQYSQVEITFERGLGRGQELQIPAFQMPIESYMEVSGDCALVVAGARELLLRFESIDFPCEILVLNEFDAISLGSLEDTMLASALKLTTTSSCLALSQDKTRFVVKTTGAFSPLLISFDQKRSAVVWSARAHPCDEMSDQFVFESESGHVKVLALHLKPEWSGAVPEGLAQQAFANLEGMLDTFEGDDYEEVLDEVRIATEEWFWSGIETDDPFVRVTDAELYEDACEAEMKFSAGDEDQLKQLIDWIIAIDSFAGADEVDYGEDLWSNPGYRSAFLTALSDDDRQNVEIQAAYRDRPAVALINGPMSERCRELLNVVVAWAAPRGWALQSYLGNRASMVNYGPARRLYAYRVVEHSSHEHVAAAAGLSDFLSGRNYSADEIERLLYPPQTDAAA